MASGEVGWQENSLWHDEYTAISTMTIMTKPIRWFRLAIGSRLVMGICIVLFSIGLYATTLTNQHTGDDLQKMILVENTVPGSQVTHPVVTSPKIEASNNPILRYFLQVPLSASAYRMMRQLGVVDRAVEAAQIIHLMAGSLGIFALYVGLSQIIRPGMSFLIAMGLATSFGWWKYSTHSDFTIISPAIQCLLVGFLIRLILSKDQIRDSRFPIALGAVNAFAVLFYLTSVVSVPLVLLTIVTIGMKKSGDVKVTARFGIRYLVSLIIIGSSIVAFFFLFTYKTNYDFQFILDTAIINSESSSFYYDISLIDIPKSAFGIAKSFTNFPLLGTLTPGDYFTQASDTSRLALLTWYGMLVVVFFSPIIYTLLAGRRLGKFRNAANMLVLWIILQIPFGILWVPVEIKWWVSTLVAWFSLTAVIYASEAGNKRTRSAYRLFLAIFVLGCFIVNFLSEFWPKSRTDSSLEFRMAESLAQQSKDGDLFITSEGNVVDFYLPYFFGRRVFSLPLGLFSMGGDERRLERELENLVNVTQSKGSDVYFYNCSNIPMLSSVISSIPSAAVSREFPLPSEWAYGGKLCVLSDQ